MTSLSKRTAQTLGILAIAVHFGFGCGEGSVLFVGSVTESDVTGYSFDPASNPEGHPPIPEATVTALVDEDSCGSDGDPVDPDGTFSTGEVIYGGTMCSSHVAVFCARAPGFEDMKLEFPTSDHERTDGVRFLNVTLRRKP